MEGVDLCMISPAEFSRDWNGFWRLEGCLRNSSIEMLDERSVQHRCSMFSYFRSIPGVFRADDFNSPSIGSR